MTDVRETTVSTTETSMDAKEIGKPSADVMISCSYGNFAWCGNDYNHNKSGMYLSMNVDKMNDGDTCKMLVTILTRMNEELYKLTDHIEIYDNTGFLANYSVNDITHPFYFFRFTVDEKLVNTPLKILFRQFAEKEYTGFGIRRMNTIFETSIKIPDVKTMCDYKECSICLEEVTDKKNIYISPCKHLFHLSCIFSYLEKNDLLLPMDETCIAFKCSHSKKPKNFLCPNCQTTIHSIF